MSNHARSKRNRDLLRQLYRTHTNVDEREPCTSQFKNLTCCLLAPHNDDHVAASGETWPQEEQR
jgi:hypothetical protein